MVRRLVPLAWIILLALTACAPEAIEIPTVVLLPTVPPEQAATQTAAMAERIAAPTSGRPRIRRAGPVHLCG